MQVFAKVGPTFWGSGFSFGKWNIVLPQLGVVQFAYIPLRISVATRTSCHKCFEYVLRELLTINFYDSLRTVIGVLITVGGKSRVLLILPICVRDERLLEFRFALKINMWSPLKWCKLIYRLEEIISVKRNCDIHVRKYVIRKSWDWIS